MTNTSSTTTSKINSSINNTSRDNADQPMANSGSLPSSSLLTGSIADQLTKNGNDLLARLNKHHQWWEARYQAGFDPYVKSSNGPILTQCNAKDRKGKEIAGINMASQDYLSLTFHPEIKQAAKEAIETFGVHSAGSPALMGNTYLSKQLEKRLANFLAMQDCTVFATGWAAGYGAVRALTGPNDHIVLDQLSHACLSEGAHAATQKVKYFRHLSTEDLERKLKAIRLKDQENGILVITETLFSMDSDTPDLKAHQALANKYKATLLVDVAHDLGSMGPTGRGHLELQDMLGQVDIVMGSFSKTFASNGGFVASNHPGVKTALRFGCGPHTFSNAISPVQAAIVLKALDIIESEEGYQRREHLLLNAIVLREKLQDAGFKVLGSPSAIVPCILGDSGSSRVIANEVLNRGALINLVEYPAVSRNSSRFRLQVMADHQHEQLEAFVSILAESHSNAVFELNNATLCG